MEIEIARNWNRWLDYFQASERDVYFEEAYVKLYEDDHNEAMCCVCKENNQILLFPFLCRKFIYDGKVNYDFETAYGYGGPITNTVDPVFIERALKVFRNYAEENNYVAGFVRFHPLLNNRSYYGRIGTVIDDRQTVAMDLCLSEESIWAEEIHTQNRNVIRKGIKNGLTFIIDNDFCYLEDFLRLYNQTMQKLNADDFYLFKRSYYEHLVSNLKNSFLGVVSYEDKIVSAAIFFYSGKYGHYHLSGSDVDALFLSPNNYMLYQAALELKRRGVEKFHLGGGTTSYEDDSLLRFKGRFSRQRFQFSIGKTIFNPGLYRQLCEEWELKFPDKKEKYGRFLLKYKY